MTYVAVAVASLSAIVGAYGAYEQSKTQKRIAQHNSEVANLEAQDALQRGERAAIDARHKGQLIQGQQRAAIASRGLDLSDGTASDILSQGEFFTLSDEATARTNGRREAGAKEAQATGFDLAADGTNPGLQLASGLLSGATSVASRWYQPKG